MPNTLARSVIASAGMPSAAARSTASSMRTIPSVMENSLCSRRWTKAGFGILERTFGVQNSTIGHFSRSGVSNAYAIAERRNFMTAIKGIVAVFLAAGMAEAAGQAIYKYQRPDGEIVYSDAPVKGAKLIGEVDLPAPGAPQPAQGEAPRRAPGLAERRSAALDEADSRIKAAAQALQEAQERQQRGVEPLPGERLGNAGGNSRLAPRYFSRQQDNAADVDAARARLDEAYRLRNEARV